MSRNKKKKRKLAQLVSSKLHQFQFGYNLCKNQKTIEPMKSQSKIIQSTYKPKESQPYGFYNRQPVVNPHYRDDRRPALTINAYATAKLLFIQSLTHCEVGGFGISNPKDPAEVIDFCMVGQNNFPAHVAFDDEAVADFFDDQIDKGKKPEEFGRIWIHTHPSFGCSPSGQDENTFTDCFGNCDWSIMMILSKSLRNSYVRVHYNTGIGGDIVTTVETTEGYVASEYMTKKWKREFNKCANVAVYPKAKQPVHNISQKSATGLYDRYDTYDIQEDAYDGNNWNSRIIPDYSYYV